MFFCRMLYKSRIAYLHDYAGKLLLYNVCITGENSGLFINGLALIELGIYKRISLVCIWKCKHGDSSIV